MKKNKIPPVHPGEILLEEFLKPMGISQNRLALDMRVPPRRINEIVHGKGELQPIRPYVWADISVCLLSFGLAYRWTMTLTLKKTGSVPG